MPAENDLSRLHASVEGRVQGVGFRYFVVEKAQSLGLTGWVRNRWDDTVEVTAEGTRSDLETLLKYLQRGPTAASVAKVQSEWEEATGEFRSFWVKATL